MRDRPVRTPLTLRTYARVTAMLAPATALLVRKRLQQGKEDPERVEIGRASCRERV